jgi:sRNA-binding protein
MALSDCAGRSSSASVTSNIFRFMIGGRGRASRVDLLRGIAKEGVMKERKVKKLEKKAKKLEKKAKKVNKKAQKASKKAEKARSKRPIE